MKMPNNTLIVDREPFLLIERAKLSVFGQSLVAIRETGRTNVPASSIQCLLIGNGVSITSEAAMFCAKHNCHISYTTGGSNVHSVWHCGRYQNPQQLIKQARTFDDPKKRLSKSKKLIAKRMELLPDIEIDSSILSKVELADSISSLLGLEGYLSKKIYVHYAQKYGVSFSRDKESSSDINKNISVLNNSLYGFISSVIIGLGYSPSLGFLHGQTRRGGLTFDIADVVKSHLSLDLAFRNDGKNLHREMSSRLNQKRKYWVKYIINCIEECYDDAG